MVFLIEYVATLATLFMLVGGFLFEATRQNAVSLLGVVGIAYICVFVLISSYILESLRFHAVSVEGGIIHNASTRDTSRLANVYGIPWSFLCKSRFY